MNWHRYLEINSWDMLSETSEFRRKLLKQSVFTDYNTVDETDEIEFLLMEDER